MRSKTLVVIVAAVLAACGGKKKDDGAAGSGSGSATVGSAVGSATAGSGSAGSGSAGSGSDQAGMGRGTGMGTGLGAMMVDETEGKREADLKTAADKAIAQLPAALRDNRFAITVVLHTLDLAPKVDCKLTVNLMTMPDKDIIGSLTGGASVEVEPGKEAGADVDCFEAVLEDLIVKKLPAAIAEHEAKGSGSGSGSGAK